MMVKSWLAGILILGQVLLPQSAEAEPSATKSAPDGSSGVKAADAAPPSVAATNKPGLAAVRYDGIYSAPYERQDGKHHTWRHLRFYSDGTVIGVVTTTDDPAKLRGWFNKEHQGLSKGRYTVNGDKIAFTTTWSREIHTGSDACNGEVRGDTLILTLRVQSSGSIEEVRGPCELHFVGWSPEQPAGRDSTNRVEAVP
jgi:hypothetical protein